MDSDLIDIGPSSGPREDLRTRHARGLRELLERRPELRGVSPLAGEFAEHVLWTA